MRTHTSKHSRKKHHIIKKEYPVRWLPLDSRFITPFFKFGSVTGISRLFLEIEITLAIIVVIGTLVAAIIKLTHFLFRMF